MRNQELVDKIIKLKERRNAVILSHNYQSGEIQDIADFVGDSLELSQKAAKIDANIIVFCGVHFMAETASILSPDKIILFPDMNAGCPMAYMADPDELRKKKKEHPLAVVVSYVNTTAEVKAESHICCTSSNAVKIIENLNAKEVLFVPDRYLGHYISTKTDKKIILWPGFCPTHAKILPQYILRTKKKYPGAAVVVHPECRPEVITLADEILSTGAMVRYVRESRTEEIILGTEIGMIHRLRKENPEKIYIPATSQAVCPNMKLITLEKILWALEDMYPQVKVPEETRLKAKKALNRMLRTA